MPIRMYPEEYFQNNKNLLYFGLIILGIVAIVGMVAIVGLKK